MARLSKEKQEEVRKRIISESRILFHENGFDKTSTSAIAKKVGIAEGTIFNYFATKSEIFMEAIAEEFQTNEKSVVHVTDPSQNASAIIYEYIEKMYKPLLKLPKFMIIEIGIVMINVGKKNFTLLKKMIELDFEYLAKLIDLIEELKEKGLLIENCNSKLMGENIFSLFIFELFMYAYVKDMDKQSMKDNIRKKIEFLCTGFITT
ncbi:MAG: TetR/AcrR family transcriptional regulator [Vallitaleaceae bacterium]|nr:TetR/AcrR family transcriptional regulator [Vallitaleaceae bacterium]